MIQVLTPEQQASLLKLVCFLCFQITIALYGLKFIQFYFIYKLSFFFKKNFLKHIEKEFKYNFSYNVGRLPPDVGGLSQ